MSKSRQRNKLKWISVGIVGSLFAVSHIGMIGYIATREKEAPLPSVDLPVGPYTSYKVSVSDEGYAISYKANDPKTAYITKDIKEKAGFTEAFYMPDKNTGLGTQDLEVKSKSEVATKAELTRAFKKHMGSKMTNKTILNAFIEQIA